MSAIPQLDRAENDSAPCLDHEAARRRRAVVADWLDHLAARTGDIAYREAARELRPGMAGRPAIDDALALSEMEILVAEGASRNESARAVAITRPFTHSLEAEVRRLTRKYRERHGPEMKRE